MKTIPWTYLFSVTAVLSACNPFDPMGSTSKNADKTTLSGKPAPGIIKKGSKVEFILSKGGMASADLWLNGTLVSAQTGKPDVEKSPLEKQCVRGPFANEAVLAWTCTFQQKTVVDYQVTVGSVESKATGPKRHLGTYEIEE
jgi:hypothetical protein